MKKKKTGSLAPPFLKFISSQKGIAHSCTSALFAFKAKSINRGKKSNKKRTEYICLVMTQVSVWLLNMLSTLRVTSYCMCKIFGLYVTHRGERQTVVYNSSQYVYKENKRKKKTKISKGKRLHIEQNWRCVPFSDGLMETRGGVQLFAVRACVIDVERLFLCVWKPSGSSLNTWSSTL